MAKPKIPDLPAIGKLIEYDPETGILRWRERDASDYAHTHDPELCARQFNTSWAGKEIGGGGSSYLAVHLKINGREHNLLGHRVAWFLHYGEWPEKFIDHIDGNPRNNRISNLRDVPMAVNLRNRRRMKNNTSGHNGVVWCPRLKLWRAYAYRNKKSCYLGSYADKEDAAHAAAIARKVLGFAKRHGT